MLFIEFILSYYLPQICQKKDTKKNREISLKDSNNSVTWPVLNFERLDTSSVTINSKEHTANEMLDKVKI